MMSAGLVVKQGSYSLQNIVISVMQYYETIPEYKQREKFNDAY